MKFYSRGKILLAGEYAVLLGAKALAVPSRLGQHLHVEKNGAPGILNIDSRLNDEPWFKGSFSLPDFKIIATTNEHACDFLQDIFIAASQMKPGFFSGDNSFTLQSRLEFDTRWGLGSSSSFTSNIAWWLDVDPYELFWKVSQGSGFDIACSRTDRPMLYHLDGGKPVVEAIPFDPAFHEQLYFVYLGHKQDSQYSVKHFRENVRHDQAVINEISDLSVAMSKTQKLDDFEELMGIHENLLSGFLGMPAVKPSRFPAFEGGMKSLGAWGGDLVLVTWKRSEEELRKYFDAKGLKLIFRYHDLV